MKTIWHDRVLALAGIIQALHSVQQIARHGSVATDTINANLFSIFELNPETTEDIYGGIQGLSVGLKFLNQQLNKKLRRAEPELLRYLITIIYLEKKLKHNTQMLDKIGHEIEVLKLQTENLTPMQPETIARLAQIYLNTISTLSPRIQIRGEQTHLKQAENIELVRALLLSGIRSAVLWRQVGGRRYQLLFNNQQLLRETESILQRLSDIESNR
ncbi:high frequency lysogenization protein HflD [Candidatus Nitrosacidococcus tergens]|uniref:High frequency lysogenization protein HflD homolog n=1 Tax=Candidatus Nitrosacidococcus tergens TaxID=553981 RepID=A0A7G1Q9V5_9GAMM|nr:high frequency lysogenization protein HflD [Candidatus Nitrosacidococcus tergens]CAB1276031.1 High frequency lysogenization protein HflD homolog [Candidatus Nitrosacidococcus tergens]